MRKKPYKTPWNGDVEERLNEDRQWTELSRLVQQGVIGEDSSRRVAHIWMLRKVRGVI